MSLVAVSLQMLLVGKDCVCKVVVLVDKEIDFLVDFRTHLAQICQLLYGTVTLIHLFLCSCGKKM